MLFRGVIALTLFLLASTAAGAQTRYTMPDTEVVTLPASENGIAYRLYVRVPPACRGAGETCPAVYLLDADYSFPIAAEITRHLGDRERIPHLIVVSIAYEDISRDGYRTNRTRDYTPVFSPDGGYGAEYQLESGGADGFLSAIAEDIIPHVERHYPAGGPRTLTGHSYGGLFALYTALTRPELFDQYIVVSPSLWYAEEFLFQYEAETGPPQRATAARFYLAVGEYEEQSPPSHAMVSELERFAERIGEWGEDTAEYRLDVLDGETHASVFPRAFSTGIRSLFQ